MKITIRSTIIWRNIEVTDKNDQDKLVDEDISPREAAEIAQKVLDQQGLTVDDADDYDFEIEDVFIGV